MSDRFSALRNNKVALTPTNTSGFGSLPSSDGAWSRTTNIVPLLTIGNVVPLSDPVKAQGNRANSVQSNLDRVSASGIAGRNVGTNSDAEEFQSIDPLLAWTAPTGEVALGALGRFIARRSSYESESGSEKIARLTLELYEAMEKEITQTTVCSSESNVDLRYPFISSLPPTAIHSSVALADAAEEIGQLLREAMVVHSKTEQGLYEKHLQQHPSSLRSPTLVSPKGTPLKRSSPHTQSISTPKVSASSGRSANSPMSSSQLKSEINFIARPFLPPAIEPSMCRVSPPIGSIFAGELKYLWWPVGEFEPCVLSCSENYDAESSAANAINQKNPFTSILALATKRRLPTKEVARVQRLLVPPRAIMLRAEGGKQLPAPQYHLTARELLVLTGAESPKGEKGSVQNEVALRLSKAIYANNPEGKLAPAAALLSKTGNPSVIAPSMNHLFGSLSCKVNWMHFCGLVRASSPQIMHSMAAAGDSNARKVPLLSLLDVNKDIVADFLILASEVCAHYVAYGWGGSGTGTLGPKSLAVEFLQDGADDNDAPTAATEFYHMLKTTLDSAIRTICTLFPTTEPQCHVIKRLADYDGALVAAYRADSVKPQGGPPPKPILSQEHYALFISHTANNLLRSLPDHQLQSAHLNRGEGSVTDSFGADSSGLTSPTVLTLSPSDVATSLPNELVLPVLQGKPLALPAANRCAQLFCLLLNNLLLRSASPPSPTHSSSSAGGPPDRATSDAFSDSHNSTSHVHELSHIKPSPATDSPMANSSHSYPSRESHPHLRSPTRSNNIVGHQRATNQIREESLVELGNFALAFRDLADARQLFQTVRRLEHGNGGSEGTTPKTRK